MLAEPFEHSVIDGKKVIEYGTPGIRSEEQSLIEAFNRELAGFIGSNEHLERVKPFGFSSPELPGDVTATARCAG